MAGGEEGLEGSSGQSQRVGEALMQAAGKMKLGVVTPNISGRCHRVFWGYSRPEVASRAVVSWLAAGHAAIQRLSGVEDILAPACVRL